MVFPVQEGQQGVNGTEHTGQSDLPMDLVFELGDIKQRLLLSWMVSAMAVS